MIQLGQKCCTTFPLTLVLTLVQQNPGHLLPPFSIYTDKTGKIWQAIYKFIQANVCLMQFLFNVVWKEDMLYHHCIWTLLLHTSSTLLKNKEGLCWAWGTQLVLCWGCEAQGTQLSYAEVVRLGDLSCCVLIKWGLRDSAVICWGCEAWATKLSHVSRVTRKFSQPLLRRELSVAMWHRTVWPTGTPLQNNRMMRTWTRSEPMEAK
jgi:hypothetical protein